MELAREEEHRIVVTGKTPAGFSDQFEINTAWSVDRVIEVMVARFVAKGQLQAGDYNLVLVHPDGTTAALIGSHRIGDYEIDDGDELDLVVAEPQKDG